METGKIPKRDRYGIFAKIENFSLELVSLILNAAFETKSNKYTLLNTARIKIEVLKRLIRMSLELTIIDQSKYLRFEAVLQEISKMTNGWINYLVKPQT